MKTWDEYWDMEKQRAAEVLGWTERDVEKTMNVYNAALAQAELELRAKDIEIERLRQRGEGLEAEINSQLDALRAKQDEIDRLLSYCDECPHVGSQAVNEKYSALEFRVKELETRCPDAR